MSLCQERIRLKLKRGDDNMSNRMIERKYATFCLDGDLV